MLNFNNFLARALLALSLVTGAGAAVAGPTYHVDLDTSALSGKSGYLDFAMAAQADTATTKATLSHFSGDFTGKVYEDGASGSKAGAVVDTSNPWNEFALWANFGDKFSFDVSFDQAVDNIAGVLFQVALLDADLMYLAPTIGEIAVFNLQPGQPVGVSGSDFVQVSPAAAAVPEPATMLVMLTGLGLLGFTLRRRA